MKIIYIVYTEGEAGECDMVFDENLKCIDGWSCNDATWRGDYFNDLFKQLGITIKHSHPKLTEKIVEQAALDYFGL